MLEFLEYLKASGVSQWLSTSMAGAPTLMALHSVGMAAVVGLSLMITLRMHQFLPGLSLRHIPRLLQLAAWGFALNLLTGVGVFITRGPEYIASPIFLTKLALVVVGVALTAGLWHRHAVADRASGVPVVDAVARTMSLLATSVWFGAVIAGRLIAYLSELY